MAHPDKQAAKSSTPRWLPSAVSSAIQLVLPMFSPSDTDTPTQTDSPKVDPKVAPKPGATVGGDGVQRHTIVNGEPVYFLFRRRRRKSIGFTIDHRGLIVSAPRWITIAEVDEAVCEKTDWIQRKLVEWAAFESRLASLDTAWEDGGTLRYLGDTVVMRLSGDPHGATRLDKSQTPWQLHLPLPAGSDAGNVRVVVEGWLSERAQHVLARRVVHFSQLLGTAPRSWRLSSARTQWGSCNADRVIRLNWRLVNLPMDLLDYVVAHELAHLHEMNHGPRFWATVAKMIPDYEQAKKTLHAMPEHLAL